MVIIRFYRELQKRDVILASLILTFVRKPVGKNRQFVAQAKHEFRIFV